MVILVLVNVYQPVMAGDLADIYILNVALEQ